MVINGMCSLLSINDASVFYYQDKKYIVNSTTEIDFASVQQKTSPQKAKVK